MPQYSPQRSKGRYRQLGLIFLVLLAFYVVLPQIGGFRHSLTLLSEASASWVLAAIAAACVTFLAATSTYYLLAFQKLRYDHTLLAEVASNFMNRLLPAGVGGIGANYAYLRHTKHSAPQAAAVVAVNNGLGLAGHIIVVAVALLLSPSHAQPTNGLHLHSVTVLLVGLLLLAVAVVLLSTIGRRKVVPTLQSILRHLAKYRQRPLRLVGALLTSVTLTLSNVLCLWLCLHALHHDLSFLAVLITFTVGLSVGNFTPVPGGLGTTEIGLVAGLVAYHLPEAQALSAVLLFRLISYWLPLVVSIPAFGVAQRRGLFTPSTSHQS